MSQVAVTINGKTYRMACDEGQENHLHELAQKFDGYVGHLKGSFGEIGDQRLTIMAAIMVVDELSELQKKVRALEVDVENLRSNRDQILINSDAQANTIKNKLGEASERIENLTRKLNGL